MALLALGALLWGAGLAGAGGSKPRNVKVPAQVETYTTYDGKGGCAAIGGIRYGGVRGATQYSIKYLDNGREVVRPAPPYDRDYEALAPWGSHFMSITGFWSSDTNSCRSAEPGFRSRLKLKEVTAVVLELRDASIVGRVLTRDGELGTETGVRGVRVSARANYERLQGSDPPVPIFSAVTDRGGVYRIIIPKRQVGQVFVVRADMSRTRYSDAANALFVDSGTEHTVDLEVKVPPPATPGAVAQVVQIWSVARHLPAKAEFQRGAGAWEPLTADTQLRPGDSVRTDKNTAAALELDLGGRVYVKPGSEVEITGPRGARQTRGLVLSKGGVWAKCGQMKESLEIQTTGGVMGIKG